MGVPGTITSIFRLYLYLFIYVTMSGKRVHSAQSEFLISGTSG